jgi:23S rRNA (cytosine1962-C5)-methyltransferase
VPVSARGALRLRSGHVWVYRSDVLSPDGIGPGELVAIADPRGKLLGTGLYSSSSQIALRLFSSELIEDFAQVLRKRISDAIHYREQIVQDTDAYRVVFSEADLLPGIIVDRYRDMLALQILTQAMDSEPVRQTIVSELVSRLQPASIVERTEARVRELEQLGPREPALIFGEKSSTQFTMNGVRFHYSALAGQKTGAFLDQRENYRAARQYAHGEGLDVFCYQGGFALHLAQTCSHVTGIDSSRPALEMADQNAALNSQEIEWLEGNAFDVLRDYAAAGRQYDTIVLDPPAFAKSKKNLDTALRGYKELNLRALKMLRPRGLLVTCSCSYHVGQGEFLQMIAEAGNDARRQIRILEIRTQAKDHPILPAVPETSYLKAVLAHVSC